MSLKAAKYLFAFWILSYTWLPHSWVLGLCAMASAVVDAARQEFYLWGKGKIESNNKRRVATGSLCGIGLAIVLESINRMM